MRKGDLILFDEEILGKYGTVICDPYSKPIWGSSGHEDDIAIVSMISVLHWGKSSDRIKRYRYAHLRRIASIVQ